jgi:hypothetical protein
MTDERSAVPRRQDFAWRCVVGAVDTDPANYASESAMLGLPMSQTFCTGASATVRVLARWDTGPIEMSRWATGPVRTTGGGGPSGRSGPEGPVSPL